MPEFYDNSDPELQAKKVSALKRPTPYPQPVTEVETIETHMAWVFLTDKYVYKLKKPLRSELLDYTTIEARKRGCHTELKLNRRLAEDIYLAVVPLTKSSRGFRLKAPSHSETAAIVDWLVKMRRLPADKMLDTQIEKRDVDPGDIDRLALRLTEFYKNADIEALDGSEYHRNHADDIEAKTQSLKTPEYGLVRGDIEAADSRLKNWLDTRAELLEHRAARVVDAHGDLRPEHICLTENPVVIDCLEFERSLRLLDPVSELSFLALECRRLGSDWVGEALLSDYLEQSGDRVPASLIAFYAAYHALVRCAISIWHLDDNADKPDKWRRKSTWYLDEIRRLL